MYHMNITHGTGHADDATARAKLAMLSVWEGWYTVYVYMHIKFHLRSIFGLQQYSEYAYMRIDIKIVLDTWLL